MKLPNGDRAVVDIEKLREYWLSFEHPRGLHKARVFAHSIGLRAEHAEEFWEALLAAAFSEEATAGEQDDYGQRYVVDFMIERVGRQAMVRSAWIVRRGEDIPRLTSCYVL